VKLGTVTQIAPYRGHVVKISKLSKTKMAAAAILKISKIAISLQQFDPSLRNLARLCKIGLLTVLAVKKFEFPKSKMAEAAILKTVKSPYLSNRLTDFDEIWQADADWPPYRGQMIKIFNFSKKTRWRRSLSSKTTQIVISQQGIDRSLRNLA